MVKALLLRFPFVIWDISHLHAFRRWVSAGGMLLVAADFIRDLTFFHHLGIEEVEWFEMVDFIGSCCNLRRQITIFFSSLSTREVVRVIDLGRLRNKLPQLQFLSEFKVRGCGSLGYLAELRALALTKWVMEKVKNRDGNVLEEHEEVREVTEQDDLDDRRKRYGRR